MKILIRAAAALAGLAAAATATGAARADNYPSSGSPSSCRPRPAASPICWAACGQHFIADWGAEVVVENKPGANNQVAAEYVAHQPGDGSTLFIGPETTFIVNPTLYEHLPYDPVKDFTPIPGWCRSITR